MGAPARLAGPVLAWLLLAWALPGGGAAAAPAPPAAPPSVPAAAPAAAPSIITAPPTGPAPAHPVTIGVHTASHPGYGRVSLDLPAGAEWTLSREDARVLVRFSVAGARVTGAPPPRNVRAINGSPGEVELLLAPGARLRPSRVGGLLVIDVLDPVPGGAPVAPAHPAGAPASPPASPPGGPASAPGAGPPAAPAAAGPAGPLPGPAPVSLAAPPANPAPLSLAAVPAGSAVAGSGIVLPFAATTGAAAFRRGGEAVLVFDEARPIDTAPLRADPVFGRVEVRLLPAATVLRLPLAEPMALRLARTGAGWTVTVTADPATPRPIRSDLETAPQGVRLRLPAEQPGRAVAVADPLTGGTLLVGTQRAPGQGIAVVRRTPEFVLLSTWQGVAVAAVSDALVLRDAPEGFVLGSAAPSGGLALTPPGVDTAPLADAAGLTRRFDFPPEPVAWLARRLQDAAAAAAASPAGERTAPRIASAQGMIALGMGAEAQAVLSLAVADDPRAADDPDVIGLSAIAALLAGRLDETAGLDAAALDGTDEVALWRALRTATLREGAAEAAAVLAADARLLFAYPETLRARLLPLAAETMALGGETAAAQALVDGRRDDASLDLARAFLLERRDRVAALAILDRLAQSADRLVRARAAPRAIELRLAGGELAPGAAADAMEKLLYAWRGDEREVALRLRVAELRAGAGGVRRALALLREAAEAMPEQGDLFRARMRSVFAAALEADEATPMPPLDLVAMVEENPDLIAEGEAGLALASRVAARLAELDLPRRSAPVLEKLVAAAAPGGVRAELGGRLAATRLQMGDAAGALGALAATGADELPPLVLETRTLAWARATAAAGEPARAAEALRGVATPAAEALRAQLLEQAKDWKGATVVLAAIVARDVPADGPLSEAQAEILLRLASAAAQAGDEATLNDLRSRDVTRLPVGRAADMLRLLVATPVQTPEDLPRARRETALAGGLLDKPGR